MKRLSAGVFEGPPVIVFTSDQVPFLHGSPVKMKFVIGFAALTAALAWSERVKRAPFFHEPVIYP